MKGISRRRLLQHSSIAALLGGSPAFRADEVEEAAGWLEELSHDLPLNVELLSLITTSSGEGEEGAAGSRLVFMLSATAFADAEDEARSLLLSVDACYRSAGIGNGQWS